MEGHLKAFRQIQRNGNGKHQQFKTCYLWLDLWNGKVPSISYPELHSYAKSDATILAEAKKTNNILELFNYHSLSKLSVNWDNFS